MSAGKATAASSALTRRRLMLQAPWLLGLLGSCAQTPPPRSARSVEQNKPTTNEGLMKFSPALVGNHTLAPLPFLASSLTGLSERLITSHHENNYGGAVKNLNRVEQELSQVTKDTPPFVVAALRDRELTFRNSKTLHEAYFGNLGGNGKVTSDVERALSESYGSYARFEEHLRLTALGLGGGSGWAILSFELDTGALRLVSSGHHTQTLATSVPLLVLDMYEHSYHLDFGAAAARYVDAFFTNINWEQVSKRLDAAQGAYQALFSPR